MAQISSRASRTVLASARNQNSRGNEETIRDTSEISSLRNKIAGIGVEDELRRKNHELMQGWRRREG